MADVIPVPTLSTKGWVYSLSEKADQLIAHFFAADSDQSYLYNGNIVTIQDLLYRCGHDMIELQQQLRYCLERYLGRYYQNAQVETALDATESNKVTLRLVITVVEQGASYSVANLLSFVDSKFEKIAKLNNTGAI